jgi:hypothetical protein
MDGRAFKNSYGKQVSIAEMKRKADKSISELSIFSSMDGTSNLSRSRQEMATLKHIANRRISQKYQDEKKKSSTFLSLADYKNQEHEGVNRGIAQDKRQRVKKAGRIVRSRREGDSGREMRRTSV